MVRTCCEIPAGLGSPADYVYDKGGNILSKAENGNVTAAYTYGNADWKDQLTAYNGQAITYDEIGNPLQYYNGMEFMNTAR